MGGTAGRADLNWPKGCSKVWNVTHSLETIDWGVLIAAQRQAGCQSVGGEQLFCTSALSLGFYFSLAFLFVMIIIFYYVSLSKPYLSQPMKFAFLFLILSPTGGLSCCRKMLDL